MPEEVRSKKEEKQLVKEAKAAKQALQQEDAKKKKMITILLIAGVLVVVIAIVRSVMMNNEAPVAGSTADPIKGNPDATVVINEYSDFQCPACATMYPQLQQALEEFGDDIAVIYNDYPLTTIHPNAMAAAEAAQCAHQQDAFWEFHDTLFEKQDSWSTLTAPSKAFTQYAEDLKLDIDAFESCTTNHDTRDSIKEDMAEGDASGLQSTPTLYINDEKFAGAGTYDVLAAAIQKELDKVKK